MVINAIMPIKLNNERLPGKNTKLLGGKPLIVYALQEVLTARICTNVYVYCSDEAIIQYLPAGVKFLRRSTALDLPTTNFTQIFESFHLQKPADIYLYTHATAPFVSSASILQCANAVLSGQHDSAFTASKIQDFLWQDGRPLNFDANNIPRTQDIPIIYRESSGVYAFTHEVFAKYHRRIGKRPFILEVSAREAIDINTQDDFVLAEALLHTSL